MLGPVAVSGLRTTYPWEGSGIVQGVRTEWDQRTSRNASGES